MQFLLEYSLLQDYVQIFRNDSGICVHLFYKAIHFEKIVSQFFQNVSPPKFPNLKRTQTAFCREIICTF